MNKSTVGNKSSDIRKLLKINQFDEEFTTEYIQDNNPFNRISMTEEGFLTFDDEFDEDDEFDDIMDFDDIFPEMMDRVAIFVKPKQPLVDWINKIEPENPMHLDDFFDFPGRVLGAAEGTSGSIQVPVRIVRGIAS